ncbi:MULTISPECIES: hypothetical protein [unclassified Frankia]|uniref:hypothetical protein n=1 Tax=unclassified Frankia TaxID=2632575 RepID=UPI002AD3D823|nr:MULTISPECIES: hypothetical protein [unclassified Frankia]
MIELPSLVGTIRRMVSTGRTFMDILEALRRDDSFVLTPFNLMRVLNEALGIPMIEVRQMLEMFDPALHPVASVFEINDRGESLFAQFREANRSG